jgi:elongator complex protein 2
MTAYLTSFALKHTFQLAGRAFEAAITTTLVGHEDWVHAVAWAPPAAVDSTGRSGGGGSDGGRPPKLLSAGMDRSMMLWALDAGGSIWMCEEAVGDAGEFRFRSAASACSWRALLGRRTVRWG